MTDFTQADVEWLAERLEWYVSYAGSGASVYKTKDSPPLAYMPPNGTVHLTQAGAWEAMVWLMEDGASSFFLLQLNVCLSALRGKPRPHPRSRTGGYSSEGE